MITKDEAIELAKKYGLEEEIAHLIDEGIDPEEALEEWDIL